MSAAAGLSCTERIIHIKLKRLGAWPGLVRCKFCHRNHREKFDLWKCGGIAGLIGIVEARLNALGWSWRRVAATQKDESRLGLYVEPELIVVGNWIETQNETDVTH
ncbi:hypothetical protein K438DRAFT_1777077 [Mycena galopus ATCC 62051]|nr:hypothetical protein K438DRAFT_1777077 [Mycena galopus ATCC 62051]